MIVHERHAWGARQAKPNVAHQSPDQIGEVFIHHSASPGLDVYTFQKAAAIVHSLQAFHMDVRGWSDIAYNYVVVQNAGHAHGGLAWVFEGRPLSVVPAAQLGHNTNTAAICIVQADPESLYENTRWRTGRLARRIKSATYLRGHGEVTQTECPGAVIRSHLDELAHIAGLRRHP